MTTIGDIKAAFLSAAYGKLTPQLMKYTASLDDSGLKARIVVLESIGEEELDTVFEILGDMVGHLGGAADFDLERVASRSKVEQSPSLPILLFRAHVAP